MIVPGKGAMTMSDHLNPAPALTLEWRLWHVMRGDIATARATRLAASGDHAPADTWAHIATAHYAAANVCAGPEPGERTCEGR